MKDGRLFSPYVCERLGWYVYVLRHPETREVFYVGKGKGNRIFRHAADALEDPDTMTDKLNIIRAIRRKGWTVESFIVRHGIDSEKHAYEIEAAVMDALSLGGCDLRGNRVLGHGHSTRGLAAAHVVASLYHAPHAPAIKMPAVLIRIPLYWTPQISPEELYEGTHGWWKLAAYRCRDVKVAFTVCKGVIRAVYRIDKWRPRRKGDRGWREDRGQTPRWGFDGRPATDLAHFLNTSVAHRYKRGERTPVKYLNC